FRDDDGVGYAEVVGDVEIDRVFVEHDLRDEPADTRAAKLHHLLGDEASRSFDLEQAPLVRVLLAREADDRWVLSLVVHHLVADGWSLGVIARDLASLYAGLPLPALTTTYGAYAAEQRGTRAESDVAPLASYWRAALAGAPLEIALPRPLQSSAGASSAAGVVALDFEPDLIPAVEQLAATRNATLFMLLLAACHATLARVCGQPDIVIGTPLARRDQPEWEDLVGLFASALPLRLRTPADASRDVAIDDARAAASAAFAHQDLAFEQIVDAAGVPRDADRHPLFQAALALQNMPVPEL